MELELTSEEALTVLGIIDYREHIVNSSSAGELAHLVDYIIIAQFFLANEYPGAIHEFRPWFIEILEYAKKNHSRPESLFQHIGKCFFEGMGK